MTVFMLVVADMIPPTSDVIPLVGIFFNAAMVEMVLMIVSLCVVMRFYHKQATDPPMPQWMRKYVLEKLSYKLKVRSKVTCRSSDARESTNIELRFISKRQGNGRLDIAPASRGATYPESKKLLPNGIQYRRRDKGYNLDQRSAGDSDASEQVIQVNAVAKKLDTIIDKLSQREKDEKYRQEWRIVAMTFDRCLLIAFCIITVLTIAFVFLNSPGYVK